MVDEHELTNWMRHAVALAERGRGWVEPNPLVGAIVLDPAGGLVGEGWHQQFGGPHAEVLALARAGALARGGTLVVTLEPCCHSGKTPRCTDAVIASGVQRVVVAMKDPNPVVAGGGLQLLRAAGLELTVGVCESDARALNAPYITLYERGRPWLHAKWAMSLDGRLATATGESKWISGCESRQVVHALRSRVDAVLVGRGTVNADDPMLTSRPPGARVPTRVVLSSTGELPTRCRLKETARDVPVIVYTRPEGAARLSGWVENGADVVVFESGSLIGAALADLGRRRFTNVLVEGGAKLLGTVVDEDLVDEYHVFVGPLVVRGTNALSPVGGKDGLLVNSPRLELVSVERLGDDVYIHGFAPGRA